jgi:hypothetical protein
MMIPLSISVLMQDWLEVATWKAAVGGVKKTRVAPEVVPYGAHKDDQDWDHDGSCSSDRSIHTYVCGFI